MKKHLKILLLLVMVVSVLCTSVSAATYSSEYIRSMRAYISQGTPGELIVNFEVTGMYSMDTIGARTITVYKLGGSIPIPSKDDVVKIFQSGTTTGMEGSGLLTFSGSVSFSAEEGESYYAVILFYAASSDGNDLLPYTTSVYKAA